MAEKSKSLAEAIRIGRRSSDPEKRAAYYRAIELFEDESLAALEASRAENRADLRQRFGRVVDMGVKLKEWIGKATGTSPAEVVYDPFDLN
jgi:hypothetical protein